jgi:tetratricopeptide (TPR) repeat protein
VTESGSGRVVLVEAEAGLGKTRLLHELRTAAREAGMPVLSARGSAVETTYAFGVARQLLERAAREWTSADPALIDTVHRVLDPTVGTTVSSMGTDGEVARLHGLYWLVADVAREPTVVMVDDAQWCDLESLRFLGYLQRRLDDLPVLFVVAVRSGEGDLVDALATVAHDPEVIALRLAPLSTAGVTTLLAALLGEQPGEPAVAAATDVSAGNPFLLTVLAGSLAREGVDPATVSAELVARLGGEAVQRQLRSQLDRLGPAARALAEAAAAVGGDAELVMVSELAGLAPLAAAEAADELATWGFADVDGGPSGRLRFRHAIVADAVLSLLPEGPRQELRRRGADVLERHGAPPESVAALVLAVSPGVDAQAARRLTTAADEALRRGAPASAVAFLERALAEELAPEERYALLVRAGRVAVHTDLDTATRLLEEATASPLAADDPEPWADLGTAYGYLRDPDRAIDAVQHALRLVPVGDENRRGELEASLLVAAVVTPGRDDLTDRLSAMKDRLGDSSGARQLDAVVALHEAATADPLGAERARRAIADGTPVELANGEGPLVCGWFALVAADDPLALASLDRGVTRAQEHGSVRALAATRMVRALARLRVGRPADAAEDAREALDLALRGGVDVDPRFAGAYLAEALADLGDLDGAEATLESVRGFDVTEPGPAYYARQAAARVRREQGRPAEARDVALAAGRTWTAYGFANPAIGPWRSEAALALHALGEVDEATRLAEEEVALARRWGAPRGQGRSLRVLGLVSGRTELLEQSAVVLSGSIARLELARSYAAWGAALRRDNQRTRARTVLDDALDLAQLCGATRLATEIGAELRTAGYRPRTSPMSGVDALTLSERRVADLAAAGQSNRGIAQALFVTPKTVELHLTNTYRKLGITGRAALGAALSVGTTGT